MQATSEFIDAMVDATMPVSETACTLILSALLAWPLETSIIEDFGIHTLTHDQALRTAVLALLKQAGPVACTMALDAAAGDGPQLTRLIRQYTPGEALTFVTLWDQLPKDPAHEHASR
jgi:hypothetical protein